MIFCHVLFDRLVKTTSGNHVSDRGRNWFYLVQLRSLVEIQGRVTIGKNLVLM
jgi:hypothetical protein